MLLQPGQGMGLLNAYAPQPQMYNPQMNHYNSLLGRIGGLTFSQTNKPLGDVGNYWMGNTLMSGSTGSPVYNLPSGAGQTYGTTQSYNKKQFDCNNAADKKLIKQFEMQLMNGLKSQG